MHDTLQPLPIRDLAELCRRVGTSLEVGIDMVKIWDQEMDRTSARALHAISRVRQGLTQGIPIAEALAGAGGAFPQLIVDVVNVGEQSGRADEAFLQLADHYDHILAMRRMLVVASIWPMISLGLAIAIIGVFILVMGFVNSMTGQSLDVLGFGMVGISGFIKYVLFLGCIAGAIALAIWAVRTGRLPTGGIRRAAMSIPGLRKYIEATSLSRFTWALALATNSSMSLKQGLHLAFSTAENAYYEQHADQVVLATAQGQPIHQALRKTGAFPFELVSMVEVGETTGRLPETMQKAAQQYAAQARARSMALTIALSFAVWGFVAFLIIAMIARLFAFYLGVLQSAGQL